VRDPKTSVTSPDAAVTARVSSLAARELDVVALAQAVVSSGPQWLDVCQWCLNVIYRPDEYDEWQHIHGGIYLCQRPLPGSPQGVVAAPIDRDAVSRLRPYLPRW
jgi:hypothetical protein